MVSDLGSSVAHYQRLGFRITNHDERYAFAHRDHVTIHLGQSSGGAGVVGGGSIFLHVDDPDALAIEWRMAGVVDVVEPRDMEWGMREGSVRDSDGNLIRFGTRLSR